MATAIGLSMQLSASTSGLSAGLSDAERLIQSLGRGAENAAKYFDSFRDATTGDLPAAMQELVDRAGELTSAFRAGGTDSEAFAAGIRGISEEATAITKAFQEGVSVTAQFRTEEEKRAATIERLGQLLEQGAINQQTYDRAIAQASGANEAAAAAEKERAAAVQRAAQITASNLSPVQRYDQEIAELEGHLNAGRISQETFNSAVEKAAQSLQKAEKAAGSAADTADNAGIKFNEISGIFSLLPGPIGSAAGRISGFASSIGGIEKIVANPTAALSTLSQGFAFLTNPIGLAVAAIATFTAAASAVAKSVIALEDRVEGLGNQAEKLGTSFQFIQVLETAADRSGNSIGGLSSSFNRFLRTLDDAKGGSDTAVAAFEKIGISAEDLANQKPEEIYRRMAVGITEIEDPATRAGVAMDLLGRSGLDLIPTFKQITNSERDLKRYFATLSEIDKFRLDEFGNSVDALATANRGLGQALTLPFVGLADGVTKGAAEFVGGITAFVKPIGQILEPALTQLGRAVELFLNGLGAIGRTVGALLAPFGEVFEGLSSLFAPALDAVYGLLQGVQGLGEAAASAFVEFTPIGIIADNIGAITKAVEPFVTAFVDGIGTVIEYAQRVGTIIYTAFQQAYDAVSEFVQATIGRVVEFVQAFLETTTLGQAITATFQQIGAAFQTLWDTIVGVINGIGGFIEKVLTFAENWLGIKREIEQPIEAQLTLETETATLAATQFYDEISKAVEATKGLGAEGFDAALKYQQALEDLAQLAAEGELSEEELKRAVDLATASFEQSIGPLQEAAKAREDAAKAAERAAQQQIEADKRVADQILENQRIDSEFGGSKERYEASEKLLAIEREIGRVEAEIAAARAAGDAEALAAASARLAAIDQAKASLEETARFGFNQKDVDDAISKVRKDIEKSVSDADIKIAPDAAEEFFDTIKDLERQLELKLIDPEQFKEASAEAKKLFEEQKKQAEKVADLQKKYLEEWASIQEERIAELGKVSQEQLKVDDVRTSAGASEYIRLATGREDPAIEEYRKQLKKLDEIRKEIAKAQQGAVEIA